MSRSVIIPTSRSLSPQTGIAPTFSSFIRSAARTMVSPGRTHSTPRVITSLTRMILSFPPGPASGAVPERANARLLGAAGAAKHHPVGFDAVTDDLATAVRAVRRQRVDGALEGVEGMRVAGHRYCEGLVVLVAAHFTLFHDSILLYGSEMGPPGPRRHEGSAGRASAPAPAVSAPGPAARPARARGRAVSDRAAG